MYIAGQDVPPNAVDLAATVIGVGGALDPYLDTPADLVDPRDGTTQYSVTIENGVIAVTP